MSSSTLRVRSDVSANAIFTPREMKQYRRWQNLHTILKPSEQGFIPTADEYEDFQQWLRKQDSGYFSDVFEDVSEHVKPPATDNPPTAILCRHAMHPVTAGQLRKRCPVCTIDMYISYTRALEKALRDAGGRAPSCCMAASPYQESLYDAFVAGKLQALHYLGELEQLAEEEAKWFAQHPEWQHEDIRTASRALELYWSEAGASIEPRSQHRKKAKTVNFAPDTDFELCRPLDYYRRRSPRYEPGKYALLEPDEEDDAVSEDSEDYSRAPVLLGGGSSESGTNVVNFYDFTQTCGILTDVIRSAEAVIRKSENAMAEMEGSPELPKLDDEDDEDEDDDDSDWDMDDETDGSDYIYYEVEDDCSFVVFGED
ncbi:hypothetical protein EKO04_004962 [Ascochyta lentis]|uniref:Uncharacterized protein n=1 Tax=Ascochyta lentis TaxID=205686 RepID=A0A8H7MJF5_9PLEO|nr:hypothetical protein EKO04_004962 [Ascochyta lentis]